LSIRLRHQSRAVCDRIRRKGIVADYREPDVIRMSPVPLYNGFEDVWHAVSALGESLGA